jgi:FlaG/FlaF family flagellin (archaellin)
MVAITVVLAAVLYVMVLGFGGTSTQTPGAAYQKNTIANGQKITIVSITKTDVPWDDVKIQVSDGTNIAQWSPTKAALSTVTGVNYSTATTLTGLTVCVWIYDVSGNGFVSGTDYFTVFTYGGATGFSSATQYSAVLLYEPSGERIGQSITFTG